MFTYSEAVALQPFVSSWSHFPIKSMSSHCLTVSCRENQMVVFQIVPKYALVVRSSPPSQMVVSLLD